MFKSAFILIPLVLCSCAQQGAQQGSAARSEDKAAAATDILFPVKIEGQYGYMDRSGHIALKGPYAGASRFAEGLAAVQLTKAGKVGYIDTTGKMVIPEQFELGDPFSDGYAAVMMGRQWGYIDKTGNLVVPYSFGAASPFTEGLAAVGSNTGTQISFGYINPKGEFPLKNRYESAMPFHEGLAAVRSFAEAYKFIDTSGKAVIAPQFNAGGEFGGGLAPVQVRAPEGMRWGYVDKAGKLVVPAQYMNALPFYEGLAPVQIATGRWGFIDPKNAMVITPQWDQAGAFYHGLSQVWEGDKFGYIDTTGKYIWQIQ
jgi:hypothetical protein